MNSTKPIFVKILATKKNGKSDGNIFSFHKLKLKRIEPFILLILKKIIIIKQVNRQILKKDISFFINVHHFCYNYFRRDNMRNKIIAFIKDEYKFLILLLVFFLLSVIPLPYYVTLGGGTTKIDDKIIVESAYESKGSFNITYVSEMKATPLSYLIAKIFNLEIEKEEDLKETNESLQEYEERMKLYLEESFENAKYVAYTAANEYIELVNTKLRIIYIYDGADTNLLFNDTIVEVNGHIIKNKTSLGEIVQDTTVGDRMDIKVLRDGKEKMCYSKTILVDDQKAMGVYLYQDKEYKTFKGISFEDLKRSSGSSAGLMMSLSIYNKLTKEDITKGLKIAGTGTVDEEGNIGEIGGIKYKLKAALKGNADIFIAPTGENYQEVIDLVKKNNYNIRIIEGTTFDDVLKNLRSENNG